MQAGRELDAKVAEALGWQVVCVHDDTDFCVEVGTGDLKGYAPAPNFSTRWESMGVLIEEARKQGLLIDIETFEDGYRACVFKADTEYEREAITEANAAPLAVSLAYLKAKGVNV